jgi:YVTN family beta-propeller protein
MTATMKLICVKSAGMACVFLLAAACARGAERPQLVAVEKVSGSLGFYDLDGKRLADVKLGLHPHEAVFSPDKRYLYVTDNGILWMTDPGAGENTISIVDLAARKRVGVIDLGSNRRPHGIDVDPATGHLAVTVENPSGLLLVDPASRTVLRRYDTHGQAPHIVLLGPGAKTGYVSNDRTGDVAVIDMKSGSVVTIPLGARPQGEAFSRDGKSLYVTLMGAAAIAVIDLSSNRRTGTIQTGEGPCRIAVSPDGKTLVYALQAGHAVGFADVATLNETKRLPLSGPPVSLTLSADRTMAYSSVQEQDKVYVVSLARQEIVKVLEFPKGAGSDPVLPLP